MGDKAVSIPASLKGCPQTVQLKNGARNGKVTAYSLWRFGPTKSSSKGDPENEMMFGKSTPNIPQGKLFFFF